MFQWFPMLTAPADIGVSFLASGTEEDNQSSYTWSSVSLGTAASNRYILVGCFGRGTNVSGVTVGGVTASLLVEDSNSNGAAFFLALVPTGTTGDIVVSMDGSATRAGFAAWRLTDIQTTPEDSGFSTAEPGTDNLAVSLGGVIVGYAFDANAASFSWSNLTEQFDESGEWGSARHSGAHAKFTTASAAQSVTATASGGSDTTSVFVSFKPKG